MARSPPPHRCSAPPRHLARASLRHPYPSCYIKARSSSPPPLPCSACCNPAGAALHCLLCTRKILPHSTKGPSRFPPFPRSHRPVPTRVRRVGSDAGRWAAAPFRAADLLPLLPRRAAWPILTSFRSVVDLLPSFVGFANDSAPEVHLRWKGACFYQTSAWLEFHNKSGSPFGGGTLHIKTHKPHSWTCMDLYIFVTPYRVSWDYCFLAREHTFDFEACEGEAEYEYVKHNGISIFLMESGMLGTIRALRDVFLCSQIQHGERVLILLSSRNIWEHPLNSVLSHGSQMSVLKDCTQETCSFYQRYVGDGVLSKL